MKCSWASQSISRPHSPSFCLITEGKPLRLHFSQTSSLSLHIIQVWLTYWQAGDGVTFDTGFLFHCKSKVTQENEYDYQHADEELIDASRLKHLLAPYARWFELIISQRKEAHISFYFFPLQFSFLYHLWKPLMLQVWVMKSVNHLFLHFHLTIKCHLIKSSALVRRQRYFFKVINSAHHFEKVPH